MLAEIVERVLLSDHDPNSVSTGHRSVRLHPIDRSGPRPVPHRPARRRARRRAYVGRARRAAAAGVRPRHPRGHHRLRRGRAHGDRDLVELGLRARRGPTVRPAVRLRAGDPRRRGRAVPARPRRRLPRRGHHRHAGPGPLGRRARRRHHRHRVLRADRRLRAGRPPVVEQRAKRAIRRDQGPQPNSTPSPESSPPSSSTTSTPPPPRSRRSTAASPRAGSSASAAPPARRSTSRRARPARPTAPRPATRWSCPARAPSPRSAS